MKTPVEKLSSSGAIIDYYSSLTAKMILGYLSE